jgi:hypothetical protein
MAAFAVVTVVACGLEEECATLNPNEDHGAVPSAGAARETPARAGPAPAVMAAVSIAAAETIRGNRRPRALRRICASFARMGPTFGDRQ